MTTLTKDKTKLADVPQAHCTEILTCGDCGHPHLVLLDENDKPIAQVVLGDDAVKELLKWVKQ